MIVIHVSSRDKIYVRPQDKNNNKTRDFRRFYLAVASISIQFASQKKTIMISVQIGNEYTSEVGRRMTGDDLAYCL